MLKRTISTLLPALALAAAMAPLAPQVGMAQAADPAARQGDREMTCADTAREREQIMASVNAPAGRPRGGGALGRGLMGFARNVASAAAPAMIGGLGGNSYVGAIAAQTAGQATGQAISGLGAETAPAAVEAPQPSADQQARLDRLGRIEAFRQCAA